MTLIEARQLTKTYRQPDKGPGFAGAVRHLFIRAYTDRVAVDHVDFSVAAGQAVACVGPNGAGKSTLVKLLSGILVPTSGQVRVAGVVPHQDRIANARRIGVLFGQRSQLWWDLPVGESLDTLRDIFGVDKATYRARLAAFDEVLQLGELLPVLARRLSLGQRMRADLAAALIHGPRVVYLDEPTIGLDIAVKDRVHQFLRDLRDQGTTLIMTSHDLKDIEGVCKRLIIIDSGLIVFDGDLTAVKEEFVRDRILHVETAAAVPLPALEQALPAASVQPGESPRHLSVRFDRFSMTAAQVVAALTALVDLVDFRVDEPGIEDVIRRVYSGDLELSGRRGMP